jgi:hypothetical protein
MAPISRYPNCARPPTAAVTRWRGPWHRPCQKIIALRSLCYRPRTESRRSRRGFGQLRKAGRGIGTVEPANEENAVVKWDDEAERESRNRRSRRFSLRRVLKVAIHSFGE